MHMLISALLEDDEDDEDEALLWPADSALRFSKNVFKLHKSIEEIMVQEGEAEYRVPCFWTFHVSQWSHHPLHAGITSASH
jgi:hypothetical protein